MAKKKSKKTNAASRANAKKKVTKQSKASPAKRKTAAKKSSKNPKADTPKQASDSKPVRRSSAISVDGVLKKFKKERVNLDSSLLAVRKKIEDLNAKTRAFEEQIANLTEQEILTESAIEQLDSNRDAEVSELLSKLGVKLGAPTTEVATSTSPFSVLLPDARESSESDQEEGDNEEGESETDRGSQ